MRNLVRFCFLCQCSISAFSGPLADCQSQLPVWAGVILGISRASPTRQIVTPDGARPPTTSPARHARSLQVLWSSLFAQAVKMLPAAARPLLALLTALVALLPAALANVEKTVFVAPSAIAVPNVRPGLQDLRLASLSPSAHVLRSHIAVAFASDDDPRGLDSWYLLTELAPGQRYEVRVCWAATVRSPESTCLFHSADRVTATNFLLAGRAPHKPRLRNTRAHHRPRQLLGKSPGLQPHCRRREGRRGCRYICLTSFPSHPSCRRLLQPEQDANEQPAGCEGGH